MEGRRRLSRVPPAAQIQVQSHKELIMTRKRAIAGITGLVLAAGAAGGVALETGLRATTVQAAGHQVVITDLVTLSHIDINVGNVASGNQICAIVNVLQGLSLDKFSCKVN
jgi:hypothetical protein